MLRLWAGQAGRAEKTSFADCESGYGEILQFCRDAAVAEARGANIIFSVHDRLRRLLTGRSLTIKLRLMPADIPRLRAVIDDDGNSVAAAG